MEFRQWIEMASPSTQHLSNVYYHGSSKEINGLSIIKHGINPPDITTNHFLTPVKGKVYITPSLEYGVIYCIGANMIGHQFEEKLWQGSRFGYLFKISGNKLRDIQPDEDSVGEMIEKTPWLLNLAKRIVAPSRLKKVINGEYDYFASVGKQLMSHIPDWRKLELIDSGAHVAHSGPLIPDESWKFDKSLTSKLTKDGSNFFDLAERISSHI